jgi:3-hydroxyacyl-CoA dehydrogenase
MKLVELVPGADTRAEVIRTFEHFLSDRLGKGVVHAKDTVNFIGNRIGCFWMLSGLHKAHAGLADGLSMEQIDALLAAPFGIPPTGLYGLLDLIGLDVLELVARNLAANLPDGDAGLAFVRLPPIEHAMVLRGQLGRKSGGGFYRLLRHDDGTRSRQVFDLCLQSWRGAENVVLAPEHGEAASLLFHDSPEGRFAWAVMGGTLCYAAELIPEIAHDVVNVDRAMRWGFNWQRGRSSCSTRWGLPGSSTGWRRPTSRCPGCSRSCAKPAPSASMPTAAAHISTPAARSALCRSPPV